MSDDFNSLESAAWATHNLIENAIGSAPTLRDQFAMAALTGLLANSAPGESYATLEAPVEWSYKYADAMMKAREVKSEGLEL